MNRAPYMGITFAAFVILAAAYPVFSQEFSRLDPPQPGLTSTVGDLQLSQAENHQAADSGIGWPRLMVLIPAGTFRMGNITKDSNGFWREKTVHEVTITRSFLIGRTELTTGQWKSIMGYNPSKFEGDSLPVEYVSWYDVVNFCNRLSRQEGLDTCYSGSGSNIKCDFTKTGYRLPTEAEWEYACRGGTETDYYTGNMTNPQCTPLDLALGRAGWYCGNADGPYRRHPPGQKEPNAFGLYDMYGNVWEMCWDWFDSYPSNPVTDPSGPTPPYDWRYGRVIRGGSSTSGANFCRSSATSLNVWPDYRDFELGFRLARTQQPTDVAERNEERDFVLEQNFPNPFNPTTTISYTIPERSQVSLQVYDLYGRQVRTLVNEVQQPGTHSVQFNAGNLPSGVYVYKLEAGGIAVSRLMTLMK